MWPRLPSDEPGLLVRLGKGGRLSKEGEVIIAKIRVSGSGKLTGYWEDEGAGCAGP